MGDDSTCETGELILCIQFAIRERRTYPIPHPTQICPRLRAKNSVNIFIMWEQYVTFLKHEKQLIKNTAKQLEVVNIDVSNLD